MTPFPKRTDANHAAIAQALRAVGAVVVDLHAVGRGVPDLVVGFRGRTTWLEVKTEKGRLTPAERAFIERWAGDPVRIVRSVEAALRAIGAVEGTG